MPRLTKKGGAGMLGGVRSPMAAPSHGLVGTKTSAKIAGCNTKKSTDATIVRSPMDKNKIVG